MKVFDAKKVHSNKVAHSLFFGALKSREKVILQFVSDTDKAVFMEEIGSKGEFVGGTAGWFIGSAAGKGFAEGSGGDIVGSIGAGMIGEGFGNVAGGLLGPAGGILGGLVGKAIGGRLGYSVGVSLANSVYDVAGKDGKIEMKELLNYFGSGNHGVQLELVAA